MVGSFLIDTSAVSKYIEARFSEEGLTFLDSVFALESNISVITKIELLSWKTENQKLYQKLRIFVEDSIVYPLSDEVVDKTIELRRKHKIKTPDAIIASTAILNKMILVTDNEADFVNIKGLKIIRPK